MIGLSAIATFATKRQLVSIPKRGMVLWHPLNASIATLPTGQTVSSSSGWTFGTVSGVPCATKSNGTQYMSIIDGTGIPYGAGDRTLSVWIMRLSSYSVQGIGWGGSSKQNGFFFRLSGQSIQAPPYNDGSIPATANVWYHVCATYSGNVTRQYVGGSFFGSVTRTLETTRVSLIYPFIIGSNAWSFGFRIANARLYNRVLSDAEILCLANEYS